jgi:hypothetical protein
MQEKVQLLKPINLRVNRITHVQKDCLRRSMCHLLSVVPGLMDHRWEIEQRMKAAR